MIILFVKEKTGELAYDYSNEKIEEAVLIDIPKNKSFYFVNKNIDYLDRNKINYTKISIEEVNNILNKIVKVEIGENPECFTRIQSCFNKRNPKMNINNDAVMYYLPDSGVYRFLNKLSFSENSTMTVKLSLIGDYFEQFIKNETKQSSFLNKV